MGRLIYLAVTSAIWFAGACHAQTYAESIAQLKNASLELNKKVDKIIELRASDPNQAPSTHDIAIFDAAINRIDHSVTVLSGAQYGDNPQYAKSLSNISTLMTSISASGEWKTAFLVVLDIADDLELKAAQQVQEETYSFAVSRLQLAAVEADAKLTRIRDEAQTQQPQSVKFELWNKNRDISWAADIQQDMSALTAKSANLETPPASGSGLLQSSLQINNDAETIERWTQSASMTNVDPSIKSTVKSVIAYSTTPEMITAQKSAPWYRSLVFWKNNETVEKCDVDGASPRGNIPVCILTLSGGKSVSGYTVSLSDLGYTLETPEITLPRLSSPARGFAVPGKYRVIITRGPQKWVFESRKLSAQDNFLELSLDGQ